MSSLPVLQHCGQAQIMSAREGGNANTEIGTAFHAVCAGSPNAPELVARLSDEQQGELMALIAPQPVKVGYLEGEGGTELWLTYTQAHKEVPVGLTAEGAYVPKDSPEAILDGTCDLYWVVQLNGKKVVYVADIKKSSYAAPDGARTLQAIGYAVAIASLEEADGYVTGIWDATEGRWEWTGYVDAWSEEAERNLDRVIAAAKNYGGEYIVGSHCSSCYGRPHCPQYLLPCELAETTLAPFTQPGAITHENALEALVMAKRALDTAKRVEDLVKAYARGEGGLVDAKRGKVWMPVRTRGRASLDRRALERDQPDIIERYTVFGADFEQFKWCNHNPAPPVAENNQQLEGETP
jgi:hypothetical protein